MRRGNAHLFAPISITPRWMTRLATSTIAMPGKVISGGKPRPIAQSTRSTKAGMK